MAKAKDMAAGSADTIEAALAEGTEALKEAAHDAVKGGAEALKNGTEAMKNGAEALKTGFEKAAKGYEQLVSFGKDNAEAVLKSANAAGKGMETINSEVFAYARKSVEEGMAITKAILSAKSVDEAFVLQSEFGKSAFETYVDQLAKFGDLTLALTREAAAPLQARVSAFVELVRAA